jgi:dihydropyrimidinase
VDLVVRGGTVLTAAGAARADVGVAEGSVVQLGGRMTAATVVDAEGLLVLPGGVDAHVHLTAAGGGPGAWKWADDFTSGTRAALAGGVTTVGNMTFPHGDEQIADAVARDAADGAATSLSDFFLHAVLLVPDETGRRQIGELAGQGHPSVKIFLSFRRFDRHLDEYLRAMEVAAAEGAVVLVHCEDATVMDRCGAQLAAEGRVEPRWFPDARPVEAERVATERAVGYCAATGATTYVVHLSSAAALEACRAGRARGLPVYVETRPVYLHLTRERYGDPDGAKYAGAPPLRSDTDRAALWAALADGTVSTLCTDHAPWTLEEKLEPGLDPTTLRHGMSELETLMPLLWSEGVATGRITAERFVELTATNPARIFGLYPRKGTIVVGGDADLVVWDPSQTRVVDGSSMHSRAGWSPYDGWQVTGWPRWTISRGEIVADKTEVIATPGRGRLVPRDRPPGPSRQAS